MKYFQSLTPSGYIYLLFHSNLSPCHFLLTLSLYIKLTILINFNKLNEWMIGLNSL